MYGDRLDKLTRIYKLKNQMGLKVFNWNGTEYYSIGLKGNDSIKVDEINLREIIRYGFTVQERDAIESMMHSRDSYVFKCGLPCFTNPNDAEDVYDYMIAIMVMQNLYGSEITDPNNGGL